MKFFGGLKYFHAYINCLTMFDRVNMLLVLHRATITCNNAIFSISISTFTFSQYRIFDELCGSAWISSNTSISAL